MVIKSLGARIAMKSALKALEAVSWRHLTYIGVITAVQSLWLCWSCL